MMRSSLILTTGILITSLAGLIGGQGLAAANAPVNDGWRGTTVLAPAAAATGVNDYLGAVSTPAYYFATDAQRATFDGHLMQCNQSGLPAEAITNCANLLANPFDVLAGATDYGNVSNIVRDTAVTGADAKSMPALVDLMKRLGAKNYPGNKAIADAPDDVSATRELMRADALATVDRQTALPEKTDKDHAYSKEFFRGAIAVAPSAADIRKYFLAAQAINGIYANPGVFNTVGLQSQIATAPTYAEVGVILNDVNIRGAVAGATHLNEAQKAAALKLLDDHPQDQIIRQQVLGFDSIVARAPEIIYTMPGLTEAQKHDAITALGTAVTPNDVDVILNNAKTLSERATATR